MICCNCGNEMPDEGLFCPECGAKQVPQQVVQTPVCEETPVYEEAPVREEAPAFEETPAFEVDYDSNSKLCNGCGAIIPLDSRFCPECRARQNGAAPRYSTGNDTAKIILTRVKAASQKLITPKMKEWLQKYKKWIAFGAGGAAAILLILAVIFSLVKPRVNLNRYITVYAEGYEGYGYAQVEFDRAGFYEDYGRDLVEAIMAGSNEEQKEALRRNEDNVSELYAEACEIFLAECVDAHLFDGEMLSEGDSFTLHWICKEATALNKYGCMLRYKDIEYTVKSLQEASTFDPFEGVEIVFEGVAPYGEAYLKADPVSPAAQFMRFYLDSTYDLSNGDVVTINIEGTSSDVVQYCIDSYGMIPCSLTKEVSVSGLDSFISTNAQISAEAMASMQQYAQDLYNAKMAQENQGGETLNVFEYLGNYLMVNKDREMFGGDYNRLYLVYKVQMSNAYTSGEQKFEKTTDLYWFIGFENVLVDDNGVTTVNLATYELPSEEVYIDSGISTGWYDTQSWEYSGYQSLDDMYTDLVAVNIDVYSCESTVNAG